MTSSHLSRQFFNRCMLGVAGCRLAVPIALQGMVGSDKRRLLGGGGWTIPHEWVCEPTSSLKAACTAACKSTPALSSESNIASRCPDTQSRSLHECPDSAKRPIAFRNQMPRQLVGFLKMCIIIIFTFTSYIISLYNLIFLSKIQKA